MMRWPLTFYTDRFIRENSAACARGPLIFIRPKCKKDEGLYQHEMEHVKQWVFTLTLHSLLYLLVPRYTLWSEVRAYSVQAAYYEEDRRPRFARFIAENYGLKITEDEALAALLRNNL